ncbi:cation transporter, putative [Bodo saltans]|uniref:Cation transporter, putative n=1 Tax=Bodo saltans TaxID=75058 RepID=A0A0S4IWL9_BODSA|nr:cation transporter, putative [Bodo saltans]|eukprot:CUF36311.1 cation transporter, putative [Bodo saltans]
MSCSLITSSRKTGKMKRFQAATTSRLLSGARPHQLFRYHGSCHGHSHGHHGHSHGRAGVTEDLLNEEMRAECRKVTVVGGVSNISMAVVKIYLGNAGGSYALLADGVHALVDFASDVVSYTSVALTSLSIARCRFPFGLGRIETTGAMIVSGILLFGGGGLMWVSAKRIYRTVSGSLSEVVDEDVHAHNGDCHGHSHGDDHGHSHFEVMRTVDGHRMILWEMVAVSVACLLVKEWLFRWTRKVGERAGSRVVVANAYHHRADAWSSGVALLGVAGHLVGFPWLDAVAGLVVSLSITKIGWELMCSSVLEFFDFQYVHETSRLREAVQPVMSTLNPPVVNVFSARHGSSYILHCTFVVSPLTTGHQLQKSVRDLTAAASTAIKVSETFSKFVHVPDEGDLRNLSQAEALAGESRVAQFLEAAREIEKFHGIVINSLTHSDVVCELQVSSCAAHSGASDCVNDLITLGVVLGLKINVSIV